MTRTVVRWFAVCIVVALVASACSTSNNKTSSKTTPPTVAKNLDYKALGLWNDGPCDPARPPLVIGLMTAFKSPVISLEDQALALEASAKAFNARGGANGACIKVHNCDDGGNADQALACAREVDKAGVVATVNDQGTAGQADVSAYMAKAGIPRVATNVTNVDWTDKNAYPLDASGTGSVFMEPQALLDAGVKKIGIVRVDLAAASAIVGLLGSLYKDKGASFPFDAPVPAGTTDFSQFTLGAQDKGVGGVMIAVGEQEGVQVMRAAQQQGTSLKFATTLGTFSRSAVAKFGDFAKQMVFVWSFPPATADVPVYQVLRADLAASGQDSLQPDNVNASAIRSWIGLYALLKMIRDDGMKQFTRAGITAMLKKAKNVPMLGIFGTENWTPDATTPGIWTRKGTNTWMTWRWDPNAKFNGTSGNFVRVSTIDFSKVMCGSMFGGPAGSC